MLLGVEATCIARARSICRTFHAYHLVENGPRAMHWMCVVRDVDGIRQLAHCVGKDRALCLPRRHIVSRSGWVVVLILTTE